MKCHYSFSVSMLCSFVCSRKTVLPKAAVNADNKYDQNFKGTYCYCKGVFDSEMYQCINCQA